MQRAFLGLVFASCKTSIHHIHVNNSRFKSQALLDEQALLSCMAYVDLNPVRAGMSDTLEDSDFTSIQQRIEEHSRKKSSTHTVSSHQPASPAIRLTEFTPDSELASQKNHQGIVFSLNDYLELTDWTGRAIRNDKRGFIPEKEPKILSKLGIDSELWLENVKQYREHHKSFIGSESQLKSICEHTGKKWLLGIKQSRVLYKNSSLS